MFKSAKNKNNSEKNRFKTLLGVLFLWELLNIFKKKRNKKIKENFIKFLKKEKEEIKDLEDGKENVEEFLENSGNIFKDFFIPTKDNNYRPRIFHTKTLMATGLILFSLKFILAFYLFFVYPYQAKMNEFFTDQLLSLINKDRMSQGEEILKFNPVLNYSAKKKAEDLVKKHYFAHVSPDGKKPWDWINRDDYRYLLVGENLAMNFSTPESVHKALMLSPSHKKNILNERYRDIGLAVLDGQIDGKDTTVLVELFSVKKDDDFKSKTLLASKNEINTKASISVSKKKEVENNTQIVKKKELKVLSKNLSSSKEISKNKIVKSSSELKQSLPPAPPTVPNFLPKEELVQDKLSTSRVLASEMKEEDILKDNQDEKKELAFLGREELNPELSYQEKIFSNHDDNAYLYTESKLKYFNYFLLFILSFLSLFLIVNIIIKMEVQHKPVIIQTMFLLIFIAGLISLKFDFLVTLLPKILIV